MFYRNYWLDLFTGLTWDEFNAAGASVSGFRQSRWKTVQKIKEGDCLLCYLTGVSRFIGVLEVTGTAYQDNSQIWSDEDFPCRLKVKPVIKLTPETAIPIQELRDKLSMFQNLTSPIAWTGHVRGSPVKWTSSDGEAVITALLNAKKNPINRPADKRKLQYRPKPIKAKGGSFTIPESDDQAPDEETLTKEPTDHTEMQWLLLTLGSDMGFDVWVARNDRNRDYQHKKFVDIPKMKNELPLQFDAATNKTIELIDVLWLQGNTITAAFEIESTTSIYSGLLRMSDLISMQRNLNIPLYLVAPDDKREKVMTEVNRPTFSRLSPPLYQMCRFISFTALKDQIKQFESVIRFLKPEFLADISESCELEEL